MPPNIHHNLRIESEELSPEAFTHWVSPALEAWGFEVSFEWTDEGMHVSVTKDGIRKIALMPNVLEAVDLDELL